MSQFLRARQGGYCLYQHLAESRWRVKAVECLLVELAQKFCMITPYQGRSRLERHLLG